VAFGIEVHQVLAEDDVVVALVTVKAERNGQSATFPEACLAVNAKALSFANLGLL
jgi:hypothetical protein